MSSRRAVASGCVVVACVVGLGTFATTGASASCVAPVLHAGGGSSAGVGDGAEASPAAPRLNAGVEMVVTGEWFREGCDDTVAVGPGCGGPPAGTTETPLRDVALMLEQDGASWTLGRADAAGRDDGYAIDWHVVVPADVVPGPATLRAATSELAVEVTG